LIKGFSLRRVKSLPFLAGSLSILAGAIYLVQSVIYLYGQRSMVDEGGYLYQGLLFAKGVYRPFQSDGLWQYNAPLSYIIPGYIQAWFGPGLLVGRLFSLFLGLLTLLGVWVVARRLAGKWAAVVALLIIALNPAIIKIYILANSQVLIACMLTWVMVLALGEDRRPWQVVLSSVLAGLMILTRHNLAPLFPILAVYIFVQNGKKIGLWALVFGLFVLLIGHIIYWPNILAMWTPWIPGNLGPFLASFRPPPDGTYQMGPYSWDSRLLVFFQGFSFNGFVMIGFVTAMILWPKADQWKNRSSRRTSIFLAVLFAVLLAFHGLASLASNARVFNFTPYIAFFCEIGLFLVLSSYEVWSKAASRVRGFLSGIFILILFPGMGYAAFPVLGAGLKDMFFNILNIHLPRTHDFFRTFRFLPGSVSLREVLANKFGIVFDPFADIEGYRRILPAVAGLLMALIFLLVFVLVKRYLQNKLNRTIGIGYLSLCTLLVASILLSPGRLMGGMYTVYDCQANSIQGYENAGKYLAGIIPVGSKIYWQSDDGALPLLYVTGAQLLPGQIFGRWSFSASPDSEKVLKFGLWNKQLSDSWALNADFILVEERLFNSAWDDFFRLHSSFTELSSTPNMVPCIDRSGFRVFQKVP
jgi:4-amino-4-deoxy-L-arabinose transferase-like glycosyltransferase